MKRRTRWSCIVDMIQLIREAWHILQLSKISEDIELWNAVEKRMDRIEARMNELNVEFESLGKK